MFIFAVVSFGINATVFILDVQGWIEYANRASYKLVNVSTFWYIIKPGVNVSSCPPEAQFSNTGSSSPCGDDLSDRRRNIENNTSLSIIDNDFKRVDDSGCENGLGVVDIYRHIIKKNGDQLFFAITFWITLLVSIILSLLTVVNTCCELENHNSSSDIYASKKCLRIFLALLREIMCRTSIIFPTYFISTFDFSTPCLEYHSKIKTVSVQAFYYATLLSSFYAVVALIDFTLLSYTNQLSCLTCCLQQTARRKSCYIYVYTIGVFLQSIPLLAIGIFLYVTAIAEDVLAVRLSILLIGIDIILFIIQNIITLVHRCHGSSKRNRIDVFDLDQFSIKRN